MWKETSLTLTRGCLCLVCNLGAIRGRFRRVFGSVLFAVLFIHLKRRKAGDFETSESHKSLSYHKAMQRNAIKTLYS